MSFKKLKILISAHILFPAFFSVVGIILAGLFLIPNKPIYVATAIVTLPIVDNTLLFSYADFQSKYAGTPPANSLLSNSNSNDFIKNSKGNFRFRMNDKISLIITIENDDAIFTKITLERYLAILMVDLNTAYETATINNEQKIMEMKKKLNKAYDEFIGYQKINSTNSTLDKSFLIKTLVNIESLSFSLKSKLLGTSSSSKIIMEPSASPTPYYPKKSSYLLFGWIVGVFFGIALYNLYRKLKNINQYQNPEPL